MAGMPEFLVPVVDWVNSTNLPQQINDVDVKGLFSNVYFLVPFIGIIGHMLYKKEFKSILILGLCIGLWVFSGSSFMQDLIVDGEMQLDKVLPVLAVWVVAIGIFIYILFIRSD